MNTTYNIRCLSRFKFEEEISGKSFIFTASKNVFCKMSSFSGIHCQGWLQDHADQRRATSQQLLGHHWQVLLLWLGLWTLRSSVELSPQNKRLAKLFRRYFDLGPSITARGPIRSVSWNHFWTGWLAENTFVLNRDSILQIWNSEWKDHLSYCKVWKWNSKNVSF